MVSEQPATGGPGAYHHLTPSAHTSEMSRGNISPQRMRVAPPTQSLSGSFGRSGGARMLGAASGHKRVGSVNPMTGQMLVDDAKMMEIDQQLQKALAGTTDPSERSSYQAIYEILNTELLYIRDLAHIVKAFITPLREEKIFDGKNDREILPREEIPRIFANIELILSVNSDLATRLEKNLTESETGALVDTFTAFTDNLKIYSQYASAHASSLDAVTQCREKYPMFQKFLERVKEHHRTGLTLPDYLIKPIQRICRYPLLIREVLKYTSPLDPKYESLRGTLESLEKVVEFINDATKRSEERKKFREYESRIDGLKKFENEERRLFIDGIVSIAEQSSVKSSLLLESERERTAKDRFCVLCSDYLFICDQKLLSVGNGSAKIKDAIPLRSTLLMDLDPVLQKKPSSAVGNSTSGSTQQLPSTASQAHGFCLVDSERKKKYFLYLSTKTDREIWYGHLERIIRYHLQGGASSGLSLSAGSQKSLSVSPSKENSLPLLQPSQSTPSLHSQQQQQRNSITPSIVVNDIGLSTSSSSSGGRLSLFPNQEINASDMKTLVAELLGEVSQLRSTVKRLEEELVAAKKKEKEHENRTAYLEAQMGIVMEDLSSFKIDCAKILKNSK